jgi:hypothetical protein
MVNSSTKFGDYYEENFNKVQPPLQLLVPIGCNTAACQTGADEYTFFRTSGWSWGIPYIAGLYTRSCQVKSDITPSEFWDIALMTGDKLIKQMDNERNIGKIVNPEKLIDELLKD